MNGARTCGACGVELVRHRAGARYCDEACRQRGHRVRVGAVRNARHESREAHRRSLTVTSALDSLQGTKPAPKCSVTDKVSDLRASKLVYPVQVNADWRIAADSL